MTYSFPDGLYTDIRIEHVFSTNITYTFHELEECREKRYSAAFLRVYDGSRWYYGSTSDIGNIQSEIDALSRLAKPNKDLYESELYKRFSAHKDEVLVYTGSEISNVPLDEKIALLQQTMPYLENNEYIKLWNVRYIDEYKLKEFYSSKGAALKFDVQRCGFSCGFQMADGDKRFREGFQKGSDRFSELSNYEEEFKDKVRECQEYMKNSQPVEQGKYTVLLAPLVTGIFAHECFGHKSEADFMVGDEETRKEWALGKPLGNEELTIIDTGTLRNMGYTPYDDEGNKATVTCLIRNGVLAGRLHNSVSADYLGESVTGNGRSISYEYEPIVRMTNTYIEKGSKTVEELISEIDNGILIKNILHGSGMSTFTLAPTLAYYIKDGKIDAPVRISVVSGNVFETLSDIDGISDTISYTAFVTGGCGKMEQYPLAVGCGGPYIRVRNMNVQ